MQKRNDRRSERTRKLLIDTMFSLLKKHTFENINVNDICAAAAVSRTTFYIHFADKYQLVVDCIGEFQDRIGQITATGDFSDMIEKTISAIDHEKAVFYNLFTGKENRELENLLLGFLIEQCALELREQQQAGVTFSVPADVVALFFGYGIAGLIVRWVTGKLAATKEEIVRYLLEMSSHNPYRPRL